MSSDRRTTGNQVPQFADREAEAAFWDSHDFADYWDALQPVNVAVSDNLSPALCIPLDATALTQIQKLARAAGVSLDTLVQAWILERLEQSAATASD